MGISAYVFCVVWMLTMVWMSRGLPPYDPRLKTIARMAVSVVGCLILTGWLIGQLPIPESILPVMRIFVFLPLVLVIYYFTFIVRNWNSKQNTRFCLYLLSGLLYFAVYSYEITTSVKLWG